MRTIVTDVFILGAGAGGFGACHRLTQGGVSVVIADKNPGLGGTAVFAGVSCFEPGVSYDGVHLKIAQKLIENGNGAVQKTVSAYRLFRSDPLECLEGENEKKYPWGLSVNCGEPYENTLKRCKKFCCSPFEWRRFMTDEDALSKVMNELILENKGKCTELFGYSYESCVCKNGVIEAVVLSNSFEKITVKAKYFIDSSGSIVLARSAGCDLIETDKNYINGVSLIMRVSRNKAPIKLPENLPPVTEDCIKTLKYRVSCFNMYPDGDININMLPTLTGKEYIELGEDAYNVALSRAVAYFKYLQNEKDLSDYGIIKIFPMLGVREDYHLKGKYVLTYEDILRGIVDNKKYIAIADHSLDSHGVSNCASGELEKPYGIPIETTMTNEFENLFVVCRGASFDAVAASSARLTRTVMSMGEGVADFLINLL